MKIAVLSGKGGAGKTMVAVNLAAAAGAATYVDCDVEEPNGRLFLKPENVTEESVGTLLPEFDAEKCTGCRKCVSFCRFNALIYIKDKPMVFSEVCHSCGGCAMVCPEKAIRERLRPVGTIEQGMHGNTRVITGILNPGEASVIPLIHEAIGRAQGDTVILDCPPGSACSVMESISDADACVLVAEPTAFGFHNFQMVHELCALLHKPCGVVINKEEAPYEPLLDYCREKGLPILMHIPFSRRYAEIGAAAEILSEKAPEMRGAFTGLLNRIGGLCS